MVHLILITKKCPSLRKYWGIKKCLHYSPFSFFFFDKMLWHPFIELLVALCCHIHSMGRLKCSGLRRYRGIFDLFACLCYFDWLTDSINKCASKIRSNCDKGVQHWKICGYWWIRVIWLTLTRPFLCLWMLHLSVFWFFLFPCFRIPFSFRLLFCPLFPLAQCCLFLHCYLFLHSSGHWSGIVRPYV